VTPAPAVPVLPPKSTSANNAVKYPGFILLAGVAAAASLWVIIDEIYLRRLKPQFAAKEVFRRMKRYSKLLIVTVEGGETPYGFAASFTRGMSEMTSPWWLKSTMVEAVVEAHSIISRIVIASYNPAANKSNVSMGIISQWKTLRWRLRLIWIVNKWNSYRQKFQRWFPGQSDERSTRVG
jgi:hypothetical protein